MRTFSTVFTVKTFITALTVNTLQTVKAVNTVTTSYTFITVNTVLTVKTFFTFTAVKTFITVVTVITVNMIGESPFNIVCGSLTGSVGKTTNSIELASALGSTKKLRNEKIALIGLDENSELSQWLGLDIEEIELSSAEIFKPDGRKGEILQKLPVEIIGADNIYLIPSAPDLTNAIHDYRGSDIQHLLESFIEEYLKPADISIVIIDAPPSLGHLCSNCVQAGDLFIIATRYSFKSANASIRYVEAIKAIKNADNEEFENYGLLLNAVDQRTTKLNSESEEIINVFRENDEVFLIDIPTDIQVQYAQAKGKSVQVYNTSSKASKAYQKAALEIVRSLGL